MSDVDALWTAHAPVTEMTHTDLEASRLHHSKGSDASHELYHLAHTLVEHSDLANTSQALDRATRVELAAAIDDGRVPFTRDDYDVAYLIPPEGWVASQSFEHVETVEYEDSQRKVGVTLPEPIKEMLTAAVESGAYETQSGLMKAGLKRLLGQ